MFRAAAVATTLFALSCGVSQSEVNSGDGYATDESEVRKNSPCMTVRCAAGTHCVARGNKATCEPDKAPAVTCASVLCAPGTVCQDGPSGAKCVAVAAECSTDADCRLESNYCGGCSCLALAKGETGPSCTNPVQCFADPCSVSTDVAACVNGQCVAQPAPTGVQCGTKTCANGDVCCNASCGICTPPGYSCIQLACN
jgi:hypothetical protein